MSNSNWRQGNRNGRSNNWQKSNQNKRKHAYNLEPGLQGFLCTCNGKFNERDCVRDSYNLLNEFADNLVGSEKWGHPKAEAAGEQVEDVDASLEEEVAALKEASQAPPGQRRFQVIESGAHGIVFIKTTIPDPCKLAHNIVSTIAETKVQKSKFLLRLVPVEATCKAHLEEITKTAGTLFSKYFKDGNTTFSIVFSHKNNDSLSRDEVITVLAAQITALNETNKVDLKTPQLAVMVEIIRSICCLSVVQDYFGLKKYNILELSGANQQPPVAEAPIEAGSAPEAASAGAVPEEASSMEEAEPPAPAAVDETAA